MKIDEFIHDTAMDYCRVDHKLPLIALRERRRELVLSLADQSPAISMEQLHEIAAVQQAIKAIEAVIAE